MILAFFKKILSPIPYIISIRAAQLKRIKQLDWDDQKYTQILSLRGQLIPVRREFPGGFSVDIVFVPPKGDARTLATAIDEDLFYEEEG